MPGLTPGASTPAPEGYGMPSPGQMSNMGSEDGGKNQSQKVLRIKRIVSPLSAFSYAAANTKIFSRTNSAIPLQKQSLIRLLQVHT